MPARHRSAVLAPTLVAGLLAGALSGCTGGQPADRATGDAVTEQEAETLARLLQRNYQRGGADFVVTAPFDADAVLTLSGEVDFRRGAGRARAAIEYSDEQAEATSTVFFSEEHLWVELPQEPARAGAAGADYLRRPVTVPDGGTAQLIDVLVRVVLNLGTPRADDPRGFHERDWTWAGRRSIDSRLSSVFADPEGRTVTVSAADDLLRQYVTELPGQEFEVTVTLAGHGRRSVDLPADAVSAEATDHPELAAQSGL
jgi:hypothetical protein